MECLFATMTVEEKNWNLTQKWSSDFFYSLEKNYVLYQKMIEQKKLTLPMWPNYVKAN